MTDLEQHLHDRYADASFSNHGTDPADGDSNHRLVCPMGFTKASVNRADAEDQPLSDALRERTKRLHAVAERSGVIADILQRKCDRAGYGLLLRNLLPAYERLEAELFARRTHPILNVFADRSLRRSDRLRADLQTIEGADWERSLPLLRSAMSYAAAIRQAAAAGDGLRLVSHAYVRYLGDLSGGQVLKKLLGKSLSLPAAALTVYEFPDVETHILKARLRDALDSAGRVTDDPHMLVIEAMTAFEHNIAVSREVQSRAGTTGAARVVAG